MPSRSQRHLREFRGIDSADETTANVSDPAPSPTILTAEGDRVSPATFFVGDELLDGKRLTVTLSADGGGDDTFTVDSVGGLNPSAVAALITAEIDGDASYAATYEDLTVSVLAVDPVDAVEVTGVSVGDTP